MHQLRDIERLADNRFGKWFLAKSYSYELLLHLLETREAEGIEDLLLSLKSATPKLPAFLAYLSLLESKGCVKKKESLSKKSKKTLQLTKECRKQIEPLFRR